MKNRINARIILLAIYAINVTTTVLAQGTHSPEDANNVPSTQMIKGTVIDMDTSEPLIGATIVLAESDPLVGATTDTQGAITSTRSPISM